MITAIRTRLRAFRARSRDRRDNWVIIAAGRIPHPLLANPERVLINAACVLIGLGAFVPPRGSIFVHWGEMPTWFWATVMMVGGISGIAGHFTDHRPLERMGALGIGGASFVYAVSTLAVFGWARLSVAVIFFCLALAKTIRLIRSISNRVAIERHLRELRELEGG